ncbi:COX15/CtaA family protein [Ornithinimicrobium sp. W1665]|uniref:COX15/CtaA family protein n=1 Tax=Ornithinimicrobium sp. W1665 TaxID=3416666 RepID=UPI003CF137B9
MTAPTSTTPTTTRFTSVLGRLLPARPDGWLRATAWASLLANALLVLTGGLVRLTGSGLGCPTWPRCTDDSWTSTREMGLHGAIEFGNRLLTFLLVAIAVLTFLAVWRSRRTHPGMLSLAVALAAGIVVQAVVGGITVRTGLNPWVVGIHFMLSAVMIAVAAVLVGRARRASLPQVALEQRAGQVHGRSAGRLRGTAVAVAVLAFVVVYVGTLVTGTGPHAGDSGQVARHTFDAYVVTRFHSVPAYLLLAVTVLGLVLAARQGWPSPVRRSFALLGAVLIVQGLIGYYQFFTGLPVAAVALHLVGAAVLVAVVGTVLDRAYAVSAPAGDGVGDDARTGATTAV